MMGFIKGKFYNRCTRIHELFANVLEQKLYERFIFETPEVDHDLFQQVMSTVPVDSRRAMEHLTDPVVTVHLQKYEEFFQKVLDGKLGSTAQFWAIYIFMINRLHRELQRCVKMNDVGGYIKIFPTLLVVYFALNRPNYARWGTLFLHKLKSADPELRVLENGAFSIRRTKKNYSRSAVDLSLEQTVNRDSASKMKGIVSFRNSESAMRRWSLSMTQRATAVTELRALVGLEQGETATSQCRPSRIRKDNNQMAELTAKITISDNYSKTYSKWKHINSTVGLKNGQTNLLARIFSDQNIGVNKFRPKYGVKILRSKYWRGNIQIKILK